MYVEINSILNKYTFNNIKVYSISLSVQQYNILVNSSLDLQ